MEICPFQVTHVIGTVLLLSYSKPAKGILDLWERIQEEWYKIEVGECQRLIESMPRRVQEVIKAKGGYTSY